MTHDRDKDLRVYDQAGTLAELFRLVGEVYGARPALAWKEGGEYRSISYHELYERAYALGTALTDLGLQPREHVALVADNRPEWLISDFAILLCGCADVPRASDITPQELSFIVPHSEAVLLIAENATVLEKVLSVKAELPNVRHIILIAGEPPPDSGVLRWADLVEHGRTMNAAGDRRLDERIAQVRGGDIFTLIYTSGTTGTPKGVMLTHDNMMSQVRDLPFDIVPSDRVLSILPVWHSYERVFEMITVGRGACTYYTSLRAVGDDLRKVKPTWMASAPRLWEGLYSRILHSVASQSPFRRGLFRLAYHCSREFQTAHFFLTGRRVDLTGRPWLASAVLALRSLLQLAVYALPYAILDKIVLKKLRGVVGGEFCGTVSGGGALPPHVDEFFNYIGIPVLEGYGMTETSPVLAVRTWDKLVIGTVGPIWPRTEIRIVDPSSGEVIYPQGSQGRGGRGIKGEIHARGPQVMKGYYRNPEATAKVLRDGWMNTGDLGMVTFNNCLKILGRSKDTIVLLSGENVEPVPIEAQLLQSKIIEQCIVVGQDEKHLGALIVPSLDGLRARGLVFASLDQAEGDARVGESIGAEVKRLVSRETGFKPFEFVPVWRFLAKPLEVGDELTATFKPRRHTVTDKYAGLIDDMFRSSRAMRQH